MADEVASAGELARIESMVDDWLAEQLAANPVVEQVDKHSDPPSPGRLWRVRLRGEEKEVFAAWFRIHQRTLRVESYLLPAPEQDHARFYEHLLRRNRYLNGLAFCIGDEDAVFLVGQVPLHAVDHGELDRLLGSVYAYTEQCFRPALRIGFGSPRGAAR